MAQKQYSSEEILAKLNDADAAVAGGASDEEACSKLGIDRATLAAWRKIPDAFARMSGVPSDQMHKHGPEDILLYLVSIQDSTAIRTRVSKSVWLTQRELDVCFNSRLISIMENIFLKNRILILKMWDALNSSQIRSPKIAVALDMFAARTFSSLFASNKAREILSKYIDDFESFQSKAAQLQIANKLKFVCAETCRQVNEFDRAEELFMELIMTCPMAANNYIQLAIIELFRNPYNSLKYVNIAESVTGEFNENISSLLIFNLIRECRYADAWTKFASDLSKDKTRQLFLSASQIAFAEGDARQGLKWMQRYYVAKGLELDINFDGTDFNDVFGARKSEAGKFRPERRLLVTIVMTTYNSKELLQVSIESVLQQTYEKLEFIIVDDASSDGTQDLLNAYSRKDNRIKPIFKTTNDGTYVSKNIGIKQAAGEFVTFFDSDDFMHPKRIEQHLKHTTSEHIMTCSMWIRADENGNPAIRNTGSFLHMNPASLFVRREVFDEIGLFDSVRVGADSEFFWRTNWKYGEDAIRVIDLPLTIGRKHSGSLSQSGAGAFDENRSSPVRSAYAESWVAWHTETDVEKLFMPFPLEKRPFPAPDEIVSEFDGREYELKEA